MKKVFSTIFSVVSILLIAFVVFVGAFCIYDIKNLSSGVFAGSFDMWYALRVYPKLLLTSSFIGVATTLMHIILSARDDKKVLKAVMFIFFIVIIIAAFVLRYFCYKDF